MKEKLLDLMKSEGLRPSQLADMLDINPAGISHILAGRNKPGFDLLQKILTRFPRINPDWLLLNSDKMYRDDLPDATANRTEQFRSESDDLFGAAEFQPTVSDIRKSFMQETPSGFQTSPDSSSSKADGVIGNLPSNIAAKSGTAAVRRVVIFYDDQTFESFDPARSRSNN